MEFFRVNDNGVTNVTILFVDDNDTPFKEYLIEGRWKGFISYTLINGRCYYFKFGLSVFRQLVAWCTGEGNITNDTIAINFDVHREGRYRPNYTISNVSPIDECGTYRRIIDNIKTTETPISEIVARLSTVKEIPKKSIYKGEGIKHKFVQ